MTDLRVVALEAITLGANVRVKVEAIEELTDSIRRHGLLQPIRVRQVPDDAERFEVVVGSRRYTAAKLAELVEVPVVITEVASPADIAIEQLVENLQRQGIDPLDEARAFKVLLEQEGMTQVVLGEALGVSQPYISNALRLLGTPIEVQEYLTAGKLSTSHVKAIASLPAKEQIEIAKNAVERNLPASAMEAAARDFKERKERDAVFKKQQAADRERLLVAAKEFKDELLLVRNEGQRVILEEAGYKTGLFEWKTMTEMPDWECECVAVIIDIWSGKSRPVCTDKQHGSDAKAKAEEEAKEVAKRVARKLSSGRRALVKGFTTEGGLSEHGLRAALYLSLISQAQYDHARINSFSETYGGRNLPYGTNEFSCLWETVLGLSLKDLTKEVASHMAAILVPNVFTGWNQERDAGFRSWAVPEMGLEKSLVWGKVTDPPLLMVDQPPLEEGEVEE